MNISTLIALFVIVLLAVVALRMVMGFARVALKIALVVVVAYLAFSVMSEGGLTRTPTGADVNEMNDTAPAPTTTESNALPTGANSPHQPHYT